MFLPPQHPRKKKMSQLPVCNLYRKSWDKQELNRPSSRQMSDVKTVTAGVTN